MRNRRRNYGLGIALLDVMACGLGALILLFLIIKHNTGSLAESAKVDTTDYQATLENLQAQKDFFLSEIELQSKLQEIHIDAKAELDKKKVAQKKELDKIQQQIERETVKKSSLEQQVATQQPKQTVSVVENIQQSEEDYLIGLKVEGRYIVILIDHSASMTDTKLINIITRKIKSNVDKKRAPKWQRSVRTAKWLLNRLPDRSEVGVVVFSESANALNRGKWTRSKDARGIQNLFNEINDLVPNGATNLDAGLTAVVKKYPNTTDLYIITDGLPTKGRKTLRSLPGCGINKNVVSGQCRLKLFHSSVASFRKRYKKKVNVVLLPLEGDPDAADAYWRLTAITGGTLLSPAVGWP